LPDVRETLFAAAGIIDRMREKVVSMAAWVFGLPALVKVLTIFILIVLLYRLSVPFGFSVLINGIALVFWSGMGWRGLVEVARRLADAQSVLLTLVVLLILFLSEALNQTRRLPRTTEALKAMIKEPRLLLIGLPALVGLLPMPGGAAFSAPLVDSVDTGRHLQAHHKAAINYWFRHILEYWWPLYPGVILAIYYSGLPSYLHIAIMLPLMFMSLGGGYLFILRGLPRELKSAGGSRPRRGELLHTAVPVGTLVFISILGSVLLPLFGLEKVLASLVSMLIGLPAALLIIFFSESGHFRNTVNAFFSRKTVMLLVVVVAILFFSKVLKAPISGDDTLVALMRADLTAMRIPVPLLIGVFPFLAGLVTGIAYGFVGASFPLVFALLGEDPDFGQVAGTTVLAYACGYAGMLLSPIHICLIVSNEYFKSRLGRTYRYLIPSAVFMLILAGAWSSFFYLVF